MSRICFDRISEGQWTVLDLDALIDNKQLFTRTFYRLSEHFHPLDCRLLNDVMDRVQERLTRG